jgi:uncharacterized membrane protein
MRSRWLGIAAALVALLLSLAMWSRLPDEIVTHWNLRGEPDDTSSRLMVAIVGPALILGLTGLFHVLPKIDPRRLNYEKFTDTYWLIANTLVLFLLVVHASILFAGAGAAVNVTNVVGGALAVLMFLLGNAMGRVRPNWFMGIRTPWTLENPEVWRRTHRLAAWLFVASAVATGIAIVIPGVNPIEVVLVSSLAAAIGSAVYSFFIWRRLRPE